MLKPVLVLGLMLAATAAAAKPAAGLGMYAAPPRSMATYSGPRSITRAAPPPTRPTQHGRQTRCQKGTMCTNGKVSPNLTMN